MKNILVVGHPRSGNHFLINTIGLNFEDYVADTWKSFVDKLKNETEIADKIYHLYHRFSPVIFKSHFQSYFFDKSWYFFKKRFHVFYMIRDGRDIMTSLYFYYKVNKRLKKSSIERNSFSRFMRYNPYDSRAYELGKFELHKSSNMVERWIKHIESWIEVSGIHIIKYEELNLDFDNTLKRIGKILEQTPKRIRPDLFQNISMVPRKGIVGDYKNLFTKEDLDYFNSIATKTMKKLGYYV